MARSPITRVSAPATNGTPKKMPTVRAMPPMEMCRPTLDRPSQPGRT
jgi:hypothetical protein